MKNIIVIAIGALALLLFFRRNGKSTTAAPAQPNDPFTFGLGSFGRITVPRGAAAANAPLISWNPNNNKNPTYNPITNPQGRTQPVSSQATTGQQIYLIGDSVAKIIRGVGDMWPRQRTNIETPPYAQSVLGPGDSIYNYATGPNGAFYRPDTGTIPVPELEPVNYIDLPPIQVEPSTDAYDFGYDWGSVA